MPVVTNIRKRMLFQIQLDERSFMLPVRAHIRTGYKPKINLVGITPVAILKNKAIYGEFKVIAVDVGLRR